MPETYIDIIRHGEPRGGKMIRGGDADHSLSELGWQQMWAAVGEYAPWDKIISSPLARCREFACALAAHHQLPLAIEPQLHEIGMGSWEGRLHREIAVTEPAAFIAFYHDPVTHRPPGGESLAALSQRVSGVYDRLIQFYPGRHLLIVAHAVVSRALIGHVLNADPVRWYRIQIDFAGLCRIRHDRFGPGLQFVNAERLRVIQAE